MFWCHYNDCCLIIHTEHTSTQNNKKNMRDSAWHNDVECRNEDQNTEGHYSKCRLDKCFGATIMIVVLFVLLLLLMESAVLLHQHWNIIVGNFFIKLFSPQNKLDRCSVSSLRVADNTGAYLCVNAPLNRLGWKYQTWLKMFANGKRSSLYFPEFGCSTLG